MRFKVGDIVTWPDDFDVSLPIVVGVVVGVMVQPVNRDRAVVQWFDANGVRDEPVSKIPSMLRLYYREV